jgi:L-ribulose-5-phosphate 3-epimerase
MRMCKDWPVSVCSWSFQQEIEVVAEHMKALEIGYVNLALLPALQDDCAAYVEFAKKQDWTISATMINFPCEDYSTLESIKVTGGVASDAHWVENKRLALNAIDLTAELEAEYLLMHFGFIDHSDPSYVSKFYDRTRTLADAAAAQGVKFLMETGQETAAELEQFLTELNHPAITVNYDPANMILYDKGVPTEAIDVLAPWIRHIHIKDATRTQEPGTWGTEVAWGAGEVGAEAFLKKLSDIHYQGAVAIEREAGDDRVGDIKLAAEKLSQYGRAGCCEHS